MRLVEEQDLKAAQQALEAQELVVMELTTTLLQQAERQTREAAEEAVVFPRQAAMVVLVAQVL
jgi:hypothetical protein